MSKLDQQDTTMDILVKMSDGNPGAIGALMEIMNTADRIDPQAADSGLGHILLLDEYEIYGTDIYILYNDKCDRNVRKLLVLIRGVQLGFLRKETLKTMASDQTRSTNLTDEEFEDLDKKVCKTLVGFSKQK